MDITSVLMNIAEYLIVTIPLFLFFVYIILKLALNKIKSEDITISSLLKEELIKDKNTSLSIFLGTRVLALSIIIVHSMSLGFLGMILLTVIAVVIQEIILIFFEDVFSISFKEYIIEKQETPVAILYGFLIVSISQVLGATML